MTNSDTGTSDIKFRALRLKHCFPFTNKEWQQRPSSALRTALSFLGAILADWHCEENNSLLARIRTRGPKR